MSDLCLGLSPFNSAAVLGVKKQTKKVSICHAWLENDPVSCYNLHSSVICNSKKHVKTAWNKHNLMVGFVLGDLLCFALNKSCCWSDKQHPRVRVSNHAVHLVSLALKTAFETDMPICVCHYS